MKIINTVPNVRGCEHGVFAFSGFMIIISSKLLTLHFFVRQVMIFAVVTVVLLWFYCWLCTDLH